MFSVRQKRIIAEAVEKAIMDLKHPEMPTTKPLFHLRVNGSEDWSFADIVPNWTFDAMNKPGVNPHNEAQDGGTK